MSRCKVCNTPLKPEEIIWRPEIGQHEDHCSACLQKHMYEEYDSEIEWYDIDLDTLHN